MAQKKHFKFFIMLKSEDEEQGQSVRPGAGSAAFEVKNGEGRLSLYVQDVRNSRSPLEVFIISAKPEKSFCVSAGRLETDTRGRGSLRWMFDPENVGESGLALEEFNTVAVVSDASQNGASSALAGYKSAKTDWRKCLDDAKSQKKLAAASEKQPDAYELNTQQTDKDKETAAPEDSENEYATARDFFDDFGTAAKAADVHDRFKALAKRLDEEFKALEKAGMPSGNNASEYKDKDGYRKADDETEYLFENNEPVESINDKDFYWVKISKGEAALLPVGANILTSPEVSLAVRKYGHLALGRNKKTGRISVGIPQPAVSRENDMRLISPSKAAGENGRYNYEVFEL